jgi:hypothetical protein
VYVDDAHDHCINQLRYGGHAFEEECAMVMEARSHRRSLRALDWLNIFMSDVQTGIGPYLAIYLMATRHWDPAHIGLAMSAMGIASVVAQTPAGALTEAVGWSRNHCSKTNTVLGAKPRDRRRRPVTGPCERPSGTAAGVAPHDGALPPGEARYPAAAALTAA